jgi:hypothetical protein
VLARQRAALGQLLAPLGELGDALLERLREGELLLLNDLLDARRVLAQLGESVAQRRDQLVDLLRLRARVRARVGLELRVRVRVRVRVWSGFGLGSGLG